MGKSTGIEWTDATWNPWRGCTKVSPGCAHCYMFRDQERYRRDPRIVTRAASATFHAPLKWKEPRRIFTCSWSDFFHEDADPWREEAWAIIRRTPQHTYQILTKRPGRISAHLPGDWGPEGWPNVWLGTSVESSAQVGRIVCLGEVPARVHFLSAEPLIAPLQLDTLRGWCVDWVIAGGESGPAARHMDPEWARELRDLCLDECIPFFLKQLGGPSGSKGDHESAILDGRTWKEVPT